MRRANHVTLKRYLREKAGPSPDFWDEVWQNSPSNLEALAAQADPRLLRCCLEHLPPRARLLEGGCGSGTYLAAFSKAGCEVVGIDFAPNTVARLKQIFPSLDIRLGDIRALPFPDATFDAYYSGGVIEHFEDGLGPQIAEAWRVLKPGGLFLVTVPFLNVTRRLAASLFGPREKIDLDGRQTYIEIIEGDPPGAVGHGHAPQGYRFHEYVLARDCMRKALARAGFVVENEMPFSSRWGLLDLAPYRRLAGVGMTKRHLGHKLAAAPLRLVDRVERGSAPEARKIAHLIGALVGNLCLYVARKPLGGTLLP